MSTIERERLAKEMDRRRANLGISWDIVASRGGISVATLRRVRTGKGELTIDAKVAIERGLSWAAGSVDSVLRGGEPVEAAADAPASTLEDSIARVLNASNEELVRMFRTVERDPRHGPTVAEEWLVDALDMRDRARRLKEATKRDVS